MKTSEALSIADIPPPVADTIVEQMPDQPEKPPPSVTFDAKTHIEFVPPSSIIQMTDIGYPEDTGVSPVAVSQPFQLFSMEAIHHMRSEIFKADVMKNCKYSSNIAAAQLRGYSAK